MDARQLSRPAIRALLEDHVRQQFRAEAEGRWHAVQNDINDDKARRCAEVKAEAGEAAAAHFMRIYAEEQLALERDMRAYPAAGTRRMGGFGLRSDEAPAGTLRIAPSRAAQQSPRWIALILLAFGAAKLLF